MNDINNRRNPLDFILFLVDFLRPLRACFTAKDVYKRGRHCKITLSSMLADKDCKWYRPKPCARGENLVSPIHI